MASQMVDARVLRTSARDFGAGARRRDGGAHGERQGDRVRRLPPRLRRRQRRSGRGARGAGSDPAAVQGRRSHSSRRHRPPITLLGTEPKRHETAPPARFTEASLIKELERLGIGRPSTYAPTIATIVRRGYVFRQGKALVPELHRVCRDEAAARSLRRLRRNRFHRGDGRRSRRDLARRARVGRVPETVLLRRQEAPRSAARGRATAPRRPTIRCSISAPIPRAASRSASASDASVRSCRLARVGPGRTASLPEDIAPADLTVEKALELVRAKAEGPRTLGVDPATGQNVYVMNGRYGAYVQLGETPEPAPKKGKGQKAAPREAEARIAAGGHDRSTVTLEEALKLLSLPRVVGLHPDDNEPITTNFGRFGPYVKHGDEFRSLESEDDVFSISFDAALALLRAPKQSRRRPGGAEEGAARAHAGRRRRSRCWPGATVPTSPTARPTRRFPKTTSPEALTYRAGRGAARRAPGCGAVAATRSRRGRRAVKAAAVDRRDPRRKAAGA